MRRSEHRPWRSAHRVSLMRRLHIRTVADLVRYAVRNELVEA
jgi:hypothetical protein